MKKHLLFLLILLIVSKHTNAQSDQKLVFRVGAGPGIEGNIGLLAVDFTNELSYFVTPRFSINPSINFFQSIRQLEKHEVLDFDNSSGFFTNVTLQYDILKTRKDFRIGIAVGPSFQVGSSTYSVSASYDEDGNVIDIGYENENHVRLGYLTGITVGWKNKKQNRNSSISAAVYSFDRFYGYYLMTSYKMGFVLK